jgi:hypothetical protein
MVKTANHSSRVRKDVLIQINFLRAAVRETSHAYVTRLESQLVDFGDLVAAKSSGPSKRPPVNLATLRKIRVMLDRLTLKPEKGRRKDLRRIEQAVAQLQRRLSKCKQTIP